MGTVLNLRFLGVDIGDFYPSSSITWNI